MLLMELGDVRAVTKGWAVHDNSITAEIAYVGIRPDNDVFVLQFECKLERSRPGLFPGSKGMITPFFFLTLIPSLKDEYRQLQGVVVPRGGARGTNWFGVRAAPKGDGSTLANIYEPAAARELLAVLRTGSDCILQLRSEPETPLLTLPIPNGSQFPHIFDELSVRL